MDYVDGFVAAVPTANKETYRQHAEKAAKVFKEFGALKAVSYTHLTLPTNSRV